MKAIPAALLLLLFIIPTPPVLAAGDTRALLQLVDYVGVDYPAAVANGAIISPAEYAEMQEFASRIQAEVAALAASPASATLRDKAAALTVAISGKAAATDVAAICRDIRGLVLENYDLVLTPRQAPDPALGARLYAANCAACHGASGHGDGLAAAGLEPPPTDFHDAARASQRSLFGLYNTISLGVAGTAMPAFAQLSDAERWALAFYVGGLYPDAEQLAAGERAWQSGRLSLENAVTLAPAELDSQQAAMALWARQHPNLLFRDQADPLAKAQNLLAESLASYQAGDAARAYNLGITAYLEGFELAEAGLRNLNAPLVLRVETALLAYRQAVQNAAPVSQVEALAADARTLLILAQDELTGGALSPGVAFSSSLVILLREGLEAILILAAIAAFMIKTERRDALKYLHYGWLAALALGGVTWAVSSYLITISGAAREVTEGLTALFAAGVLFYIGFWMHNKLNARRWTKFLQDKIQSALDAHALWTLAAVSFVAVYREVFETILFYQALWAQTDASAHGAVFGGMGAAALLLVLATWGIFKFGLRLPLKQFFAISAAVMFVLAVIFAGKGVAALQEAGKLPIDPVSFPRIELLGIYPNAQSLALQAAFVLIALGLIWYNRRAETG